MESSKRSMLFMYILLLYRQKKNENLLKLYLERWKNWSLTQLSGMCCIEKAIKISTKINQLASKEVVLIWLHSYKKEIRETNMEWGRLHFIYTF